MQRHGIMHMSMLDACMMKGKRKIQFQLGRPDFLRDAMLRF